MYRSGPGCRGTNLPELAERPGTRYVCLFLFSFSFSFFLPFLAPSPAFSFW